MDSIYWFTSPERSLKRNFSHSQVAACGTSLQSVFPTLQNKYPNEKANQVQKCHARIVKLCHVQLRDQIFVFAFKINIQFAL